MRPNNEPGFQDGLNQLPKSKLRIKDPTLNKVTKKIPFCNNYLRYYGQHQGTRIGDWSVTVKKVNGLGSLLV